MKQKRKQLPEKQKPANGKLLQWHPAFYADLQIEFREETEKLKFEREYLLSSKPMAIDVLIIKKKYDYCNWRYLPIQILITNDCHRREISGYIVDRSLGHVYHKTAFRGL